MDKQTGNVGLVKDTPFGYTLSLISGKWKMVILFLLSDGPIRYNELQRQIGPITYKTLTVQLKELEADDLITRTEYPQIPPKVEYSLSDRGQSLMPILEALCAWGLTQQSLNPNIKLMPSCKR